MVNIYNSRSPQLRGEQEKENTMKINGTTIRRNTTHVVVTRYDHSHCGPAGSVISQHKTYESAKKSCGKTSGYGRIVDIRDARHLYSDVDNVRAAGETAWWKYGHDVTF